MDFLKEALGELFAPFSEKIEAFNQAHPERRIKLCDLSAGNYVSRGKFSDLEAEAKRLKEQLSIANADSADELHQQLQTLQKRYDDDVARLSGELSAAKFDGAIDLALQKYGARNAKAVRALLDLDQLSLEDGAVVGLSAQLDAIREENGFLFQSGAVSTGMSVGAPKPPADGFIASARTAAGLI